MLLDMGPVICCSRVDPPQKCDPGVGFSQFNSRPASQFIGGLPARPRLQPAARRERRPSIAREPANGGPLAARRRLAIRDTPGSRASRWYSVGGRGASGGKLRAECRVSGRPRAAPRAGLEARQAPKRRREATRPDRRRLRRRSGSRRAVRSAAAGVEGRADGVLGFARASPPAFIDPQGQRWPRGAGIVERRPKYGEGLLSRLRPCGGPRTIAPIRA